MAEWSFLTNHAWVLLLISLFTERIPRPLSGMIATSYWPQRLAYSGHWHSL